MTSQTNFDEHDQQTLINLMISEPSVFTRIKPIIKPEYFDKKFHQTISYLLDFSTQYNSLPTLIQLNNESRINYEIIDGLKDNLGVQQSVLDTIEFFCKKRALELAVNQCYELIQKGQTTGIDAIIKSAQNISIQKDLGINYWDNTAEWLHKLDVEMGLLPTGWNTFDLLFDGGFSWGQLNYVVSPSGGGKSLCMANLALNWSLMGYNVLYLTLELDKELVGKRIMAMERGIPYRNISANVEHLSEAVTIRKIKDKPGLLQIIDLPRATTPSEVEAIVQTFEMEKGIPIHIIAVDYAGIMNPSDKRIDVNNIHLRDKHIAEELRELARSRTHNGKKTMVISANQIIKQGAGEMEFNQSDIAGGSTLVHTCDNLFSVRTNDAMRQKGEYEFKIIKCRNAGGVDKKFKMSFNIDTLLISSIEEVQPTNPLFNNPQNVQGALNTLIKLKTQQ